jgi:hypothetical protein
MSIALSNALVGNALTLSESVSTPGVEPDSEEVPDAFKTAPPVWVVPGVVSALHPAPAVVGLFGGGPAHGQFVAKSMPGRHSGPPGSGGGQPASAKTRKWKLID